METFFSKLQLQPNMDVKEFCVSEGTPVKQITIKPVIPTHLLNGPRAAVWHGVRAVLVSYSAALQQLWIPGHSENKGEKTPVPQVTDVVLGYGNLEGYEKNVPYIGATVGRVAGRISGGRFSIPLELDPSISSVYRVPQNNNNRHCLHGGL